MKSTMMDYPLTLSHILDRGEKLFGRVEIVSRMPDMSIHRYDYQRFSERAKSLALALQTSGLKRGDRVATLMWNHYAHLEAYFGVPAAGGVYHTLNLRLSHQDLAYIVNQAEDRFLIVDDVLLPIFDKFKGEVNFDKVFVVPLTRGEVTAPYVDYEQFLGQATGTFEYPRLDEGEPAGMCYTSGTTGRPKGVAYSHRSIVLHSFGISLPDYANLSQSDTLMPAVPMFHANAWGLPFAGVMVGLKLVLPGPYLDGVSLLDLLETEKVTVSAGVPSIWLGILQVLQKEPERWQLTRGLRMLVGGSAAPESMIRGFDKFGINIVHAWGMTETTPLGTLSMLKRQLGELDEERRYFYRAKQGIPAPFIDVRVANDQGVVPWDGRTNGELQVRGAWVAGSYHNLPEASDRWTEDGWFKTGDVATIDEEGYVKITDRTKDLIKSGGEWISSVDLENALMGHPAVAEAAVIAVPHPKWGERPLAVVVLKKDYPEKVTEAELNGFLAPKFADWWLPDEVVLMAELPKTSAGKFAKAVLRDQFKDWKPKEQTTK